MLGAMPFKDWLMTTGKIPNFLVCEVFNYKQLQIDLPLGSIQPPLCHPHLCGALNAPASLSLLLTNTGALRASSPCCADIVTKPRETSGEGNVTSIQPFIRDWHFRLIYIHCIHRLHCEDKPHQTFDIFTSIDEHFQYLHRKLHRWQKKGGRN